MPAKIAKVWDGTDPGATPGRVFTASIGQEEIIQEDKFLDSLDIGFKGAISTAAVAIESFVGVLSEFNVKVGAETRILMDLRQLCALMLMYYGELPFIWENTDNTGNNFVGGLRIPLQTPCSAEKPITLAATRTAVTNVGTETLAVYARFDSEARGKKPIHAVAINKTTAAAAGYDEMSSRIAPVGTLVGLIFQQANVFADGNVDVSIQRAILKVNGQRHSEFNLLAHNHKWSGRSVGVLDPMDDLMNPFCIVDLRDIGGIDCKNQEVVLELDVQDVSDAITVIPVIEMA